VKKANPQNLYEKHVTIKDTESEPQGSLIPDLLAATPGNTVPVADITTTESTGDITEFLESSTEHSKPNPTESLPAHGNLKETLYRGVTTERNVLSTSTEFIVVQSNAEDTFSTEHTLEEENVVGTDKSPYSESKQRPLNTEHSTKSSVSLPEPNIKRTDTRSLMAKILGTTTSTKISHETEICYRGRCIKTKTKDSDIDQFSTD
jgi:viroplasmin and RNaseH domain-containing protein